jgi:hypothetical protein
MHSAIMSEGSIEAGGSVLPDPPENDNLRGLESGVQARLTGYIRSGGIG